MFASIARPAALLALAAALTAVAAAPATAQMVPRLVSYAHASVVTGPCSSGPQALSERRTVTYEAAGWTQTITLYQDPGCTPASALLAFRSGGSYGTNRSLEVAYRTVTPTALGQAFLERECSGFEWIPGVARAVGSCDALAALESATGSP